MRWWLTDWSQREGPGIPKDAPKKRGLALFAQIVLREAWDLFKLNLLIVLASLPLVTAPAAHAAASAIAAKMVGDENIYLWREFWSAFRAGFSRATLAGLVGLAVLGASSYSLYIWAQVALAVPLAAAALVIGLAAVLFGAMVLINLFVLIGTRFEPIGVLLRLAFLAALARPLALLGAMGFVAALWAAHILFYPVSVFMPAVLNFSLGVLALTFASLHALSALPKERDGDTASTRNFASAHAATKGGDKCERLSA